MSEELDIIYVGVPGSFSISSPGTPRLAQPCAFLDGDSERSDADSMLDLEGEWAHVGNAAKVVIDESVSAAFAAKGAVEALG
eukprot:8526821-Lingulodinium_polyedra.AAC.1